MNDALETVVLVDASDREVGTAPKLEAHRRGDLHRAFSVGDGLIEHEFVHLFAGVWSGSPRPNAREIEDCDWRARDEVRREVVENPERFTAWFRRHLDDPACCAKVSSVSLGCLDQRSFGLLVDSSSAFSGSCSTRQRFMNANLIAIGRRYQSMGRAKGSNLLRGRSGGGSGFILLQRGSEQPVPPGYRAHPVFENGLYRSGRAQV